MQKADAPDSCLSLPRENFAPAQEKIFPWAGRNESGIERAERPHATFFHLLLIIFYILRDKRRQGQERFAFSNK